MSALLPPLKDLLFGFELEGIIPWPPDIGTIYRARETYAGRLERQLGQPVAYDNMCSSWSPNSWTVTQDKTIRRRHPVEVDIEIKSPIFVEADLDMLPAYFTDIAATSLQTNETCALHLHMGRKGQLLLPLKDRHTIWRGKQIVRFMTSFENNMDHVLDLIDPERFNSEYCRVNSLPGLTPRTNKNLSQISLAYCGDGVASISRTYAVNLCALFKTGTVEVRLRQARDFVNATPFIGVMLHMMQAAIDGRNFDWNSYAEAVAGHPALSLAPRPSRPTLRREYPAASSVQPGTG